MHELLAHTPHDHVERKSLQHARQQLEDLSRQMHDEVFIFAFLILFFSNGYIYFCFFQVSETENLRKNLAVERMIIEGCDILLDVNQVFVRQGALLKVFIYSTQRKKDHFAKILFSIFTSYTVTFRSLVSRHNCFIRFCLQHCLLFSCVFYEYKLFRLLIFIDRKVTETAVRGN